MWWSMARSDFPPLLIAAGGLIITIVFSFRTDLSVIGPSYVLFAADGLISVYAAYWALDIRRGLPVPMFRKQALGLALVALAAGLGASLGNAVTEFSGGEGFLATIAFYEGVFIVPIVAFYWIDSTTLASRRADPSGRNTFHWTRVRIPIWGLIVGSFLVNLCILIVAVLTGVSSAILYGLEPFPDPTVEGVIIFVNFAPTFALVITGLSVLPVVARRSKDRTFRSHILWFAIAILSASVVSTIIVTILGGSLPPSQAGCALGYENLNGQCVVAAFDASIRALELAIAAVNYVFLAAGGFFLYRSAKSLVPMNRRLTPQAEP